jgi:hypothetical protein
MGTQDRGPSSDNLTPKKRLGGAIPPGERSSTQARFLLALARHGNVTQACKTARISRDTIYIWRHDDVGFAGAWDDALKAATDELEREAWRRAMKGTKKPIYQGGQHVGDVQEFSDTLLIFLMKGAAPEKYRERTLTEQQHSGNVKIAIEYVNDWRPKLTGNSSSEEEPA